MIEWTNRGSPIYATALGLVPPALEGLKPKINQQSIKHATRKVPEGLIRYISCDQNTRNKNIQTELQVNSNVGVVK